MKKYQKYNEAAKVVGSKAWSSNRYHNLKHNALHRRAKPIEFTLTLDETRKLYETERCYFCEDIAKIRTVDRVDNEIGYTSENCVMACRECNIMKGRLVKSDIDRMLNILRKM